MVVFCGLDADENVIQFCGRRFRGARHRTLPQLMVASWSRFLSAASGGRRTTTAAAAAYATARVRRLAIED